MNRRIVASAAALVFAGCGGGGGAGVDGGGSEKSLSGEEKSVLTSPVVFPVEATLVSLGTSTGPLSAHYTDPATGDVYMLSYRAAPAPDASFEGQQAKAANLAIEVRKNGVVVSSSSATSYFQQSPFRALGGVIPGSTYIVSANHTSLPAFGKVGDSGDFNTSTYYRDSTKSVTDGTGVTTWSISAAETTDTAYICGSTIIKASNGSTSVGSNCPKVNTAGSILGLRFMMIVDGKTIVFES